jgi:hypothetical protein
LGLVGSRGERGLLRHETFVWFWSCDGFDGATKGLGGSGREHEDVGVDFKVELDFDRCGRGLENPFSLCIDNSDGMSITFGIAGVCCETSEFREGNTLGPTCSCWVGVGVELGFAKKEAIFP